MKLRLGAVLSVLLGSVLIWIGLAASGTAVAGTTTPPAPCPLPLRAVAHARTICPTGTITVTEVTDLSADPSANPPSQWTVTITSANCTMPDGSTPVHQVLAIDNNGDATTDPLEIDADVSGQTHCEYAYVETPKARYTTTYDPTPPQSIPDTGADSNLAVTVTNTIAALPTSSSPAPTHTRTHTATATPTHTKSMSSSAAPTAVTSTSSSPAPILAVTGPRRSVGPSLYAGIGLCGLGLVLLLTGRRPRTARHR
jgi:hypothetical protein